MMEKPLDGAGLAELWKLIKEEDLKNAKIAYGSYSGTGSSGSSGKTSLSVGFAPKFVVVFSGLPSTTGASTSAPCFMIRGANGITYAASGAVSYPWGLTATWSDTGVSWYGGDENKQCNAKGKTYSYIAIG